jgi:hypothetical protein
MLKGQKDGVMIIKPGHLKIGNTKYGQMISDFCCKVDKNCTLLGYYVSSFLTTTHCTVTQKKQEEHSSYGQMSHPSCCSQHEGGSVMIWTAMSWYSAGPIVTLNGQITASGYIDTLGASCGVSQLGCNLSRSQFAHTHSQKYCLGLRSMKMHFNIFPGQHNHQTSISLNQCGQLYRVG